MGSKHIFSLHLRYSDFITLSSKPTCHLPQRETLSLSSEASLKTKMTTLPSKVVYHIIPLKSWWITMDRQSQHLIHQRGINVRNLWSDLSSTQRTSIKTSRSYGGLCDVFFLSETFCPFFFFFKLNTSLSSSMSLISDKKYTIILIVFSRKTEAFIPFGWFEDLLFITIFKSFDVHVPWHRFLCVSFQSVLGSLDMWLYTFSLVWKILAISSSYIFLSHLFLLPIGEYNYIFSSPMKNAIILGHLLMIHSFLSYFLCFSFFFHLFLLVGG